ncbi:ribosomal protein L17 [Sporosarcina luteola]|nr:ribosomal protein L17 [Sporosarcina luteola]
MTTTYARVDGGYARVTTTYERVGGGYEWVPTTCARVGGGYARVAPIHERFPWTYENTRADSMH